MMGRAVAMIIQPVQTAAKPDLAKRPKLPTLLLKGAYLGKPWLVKLALRLPFINVHSAVLNNGLPCMNALHVACKMGHAECVRLLLSRIHPNIKSSGDGLNALMVAAKHGRLDCVSVLLECKDAYFIQGSNIDREGAASSLEGWTALMFAANGGHTDCVKRLLEVDDPLKADPLGRDALMLAAMASSTGCVKVLIPFSNAKAKSRCEDTALALSVREGDHESVKALLPFSDCDALNPEDRHNLLKNLAEDEKAAIAAELDALGVAGRSRGAAQNRRKLARL